MLRVSFEDESDLRWYYARDYESEMGKHSSAGGILDTIERGAVLTKSYRSGDLSERVLRTARRLDQVRTRLGRCSVHTRMLLAAAFGPTRYPGLEPYAPATDTGTYAGALLVVPELIQAHRQDGTDRSLLDWLQRLGTVAQNASGKIQPDVQAAAMKRVAAFRAALEQRLTEALAEYGARVEAPPTSRESVTVRELARALGLHPSTVSVRLTERRVPWGRRSGRTNEAARIQREDLATLWPEAAQALEGVG